MKTRALVLATALAAASPAAAASISAPDTLADSTVVQQWTLDNGLVVSTRHVPMAGGVAITVGYAYGTDDDPPGKEGLAMVVGELAYTAATSEAPERTRDELDSQRPLGWSFPVSRRSTLFTEVASLEQFPGVLGQVASRMRGVQLTPEGLAAAVKNARGELSRQLFGNPLEALYYQVREVAVDRKDEDILARAAGRYLAKLTIADADREIRRVFVPANAVLALSGNLAGMDVHGLVSNLFGSIPRGTAAARRPAAPLQPRSRVMHLAGVTGPAAAVGVIAPAIADSLHPSFYLNALLLGSHFNHIWLRDEEGKAPNRYHYAIFDEPELMRLFPPMSQADAQPEAAVTRVEEALNTLSTLIVTSEPYEELRSSTLWLLGGAMPPALAERAPRDGAVLHTMARTMAARALWGGEAFWSDYRARFEHEPPGNLARWLAWFKDPQHQVSLLALPRR